MEVLEARQPAVPATFGRCLAAIGGMAERVRRLGLVARFTIVGATVAMLVAGGLGWLVEARLTDMMLRQVVARASDQIELVVQDRVSPLDFEPPYTPERMDDLAA